MCLHKIKWWFGECMQYVTITNVIRVLAPKNSPFVKGFWNVEHCSSNSPYNIKLLCLPTVLPPCCVVEHRIYLTIFGQLSQHLILINLLTLSAFTTFNFPWPLLSSLILKSDICFYIQIKWERTYSSVFVFTLFFSMYFDPRNLFS